MVDDIVDSRAHMCTVALLGYLLVKHIRLHLACSSQGT